MKRRTVITIFAVVLAASCGKDKSAAPPAQTTGADAGVPDAAADPEFVCGVPIEGEAQTGTALQDLGVHSVAYTLVPEEDTMALTLRDADGTTVGTAELGTQVHSIVSTTLRIALHDADGAPLLEEAASSRYVPGLGSEIEVVRTAGGATLRVWKVLTNAPEATSIHVAVAAADVSGQPTLGAQVARPDGEFWVLPLLVGEVDRSDELAEFATQTGVDLVVSGPAQALKAALLADEGWRSVAFAHFATCVTGVPVAVRSVAGLGTITPEDDSPMVRQALSCDDNAGALVTSENIGKATSLADTVLGILADGTAKGMVIANADKFGAAAELDIGGGFTFKITPQTLVDLKGAVVPLAGVAAVTTAGVTTGVAVATVLGGLGAAAFVIGTVNAAFGEDIAEWHANRNRPQTLAERDAAAARAASSSGDPHLRTPDGLLYDLQTQGDYVFVRATRGAMPLDVHVRQAPAPGPCSSHVTYNKGVATRMGDTRISLYTEDPRGTVRVDGELYDLLDAGPLFLDGGTVSVDDGTVVVMHRSGDTLFVDRNAVRINLTVALTEARRGAIEGLAGNFDGAPQNDLRVHGGPVLGRPVLWDDLVDTFADSWLVPNGESLLDYRPGESPADYHDPDVPNRPLDLSDLDDADAARARTVCAQAGVNDPAVLADCILDVVCMQDDDEAQAHARIAPPRLDLDVARPVFLDGWTQQGPLDAGNWTVSPDGRSVSQAANGQPTFFVSDRNYRDVTIEGTLQTTLYDDDYIGFVFGYNAPIAAAGDGEDELDFLVFSWKGRLQTPVSPGFTLARAQGTFTVTDIDTAFWQQQSLPTYQVLATDYGDGRQFIDSHPHRFTLSYGRDRVRIALDGRLIFDVTAAEAGLAEFPDGRFGFYNFSQPNVTYAGFRAVPGAREVGLSAFQISDFTEVAGDLSLRLLGTIQDRALRLTEGANTRGNAWYHPKFTVGGGFTTDFTFRVSGPDATRRGGFALVLQNADLPFEQEGTDLGYARIPHSLAIELDLRTTPHVALHTALDQPNTAEDTAMIASAPLTRTIDDAEVHWARVRYDAATTRFAVYVDDPHVPVLETTFDLGALRFDNGNAYLGFSAQASTDPQTFEILSWGYQAQDP